MAYLIRRIQDEDIPQVLQIDQEAFPTQWPHPTYTSFKHELRNRLARYIVACEKKQDNQGITNQTGQAGDKSFWQKFSLAKLFTPATYASSRSVIPVDQKYIVGYAGFWIMIEEAHLTTIAVRETYRRRGIGELLLISVIDLATQLDARMVTLEVRLSNKSAQSLYERYNFKSAGVRRHYYSDNGEDALIMSTDNITSASFQAQFQRLKELHRQKWGETFAYTLTRS